jgi:phosphoglycerate dehydrogenase-like enzyme
LKASGRRDQENLGLGQSKGRITDATLQFLTTMKNVLVTPHSAWLTREPIGEIAIVTAQNTPCFASGLEDTANPVPAPQVVH